MQENNYLRWVSAVIASAVCTIIGLSGANYAYADSADCSLKDVSAWKARLTDPTEEASPDYKLRVSEDFIQDCPYRPEVMEAHQIAGLAAIDAGAADAVIDHLESARTPYQPLDTRAWFGLIAAKLETGERKTAWRERDALVAHWLDRIDIDGLADVDTHKTRGGVIYSARFIALEPGDYVRGVWLAVPNGDGWPSAVVLGSSGFRSALNQLRSPGADRLEQIDLIGCQERITLWQMEGEIPFETAHEAALAASRRYLEVPELPGDNGSLDMSVACIWPQKMLPRPDPYTAELID